MNVFWRDTNRLDSHHLWDLETSIRNRWPWWMNVFWRVINRLDSYHLWDLETSLRNRWPWWMNVHWCVISKIFWFWSGFTPLWERIPDPSLEGVWYNGTQTRRRKVIYLVLFRETFARYIRSPWELRFAMNIFLAFAWNMFFFSTMKYIKQFDIVYQTNTESFI